MSAIALSWTPTKRPAKSRRYKPIALREDRAAHAARIFLLAATALYLAVEIPFAADLVVLLSSNPSHEALSGIERLGRMVSGLALALAVWGWLLPRLARKRIGPVGMAVRLGLVGALCVWAMMTGQRTLVDRLAEGSTPAQRMEAMRGAVARNAAIDAMSADADGGRRALAGATAYMAMGDGSVYAGLPHPRSAIRSYGAATFPTRAVYARDAAGPAAEAVRNAYEGYKRASARLVEVRRASIAKAEGSWEELQDTVAKRRLDLTNPWTRHNVRYEVSRRGIPVPDGWDPRDREGFMRAALDGPMRSARAAYDTETARALGPGSQVPLGLASFEAFSAQPAVQSSLRKGLGLPEKGPAIRPEPGPALAAAHYEDARKRHVERLATALDGKPTLPNDMADRGMEAVRLAYAAAFGIVLSALGAAGHIAKLAYYMAATAIGPTHTPDRRPLLASGLVAAGILASAIAVAPNAPSHVMGTAAGAHALLAPIGKALANSPALELARSASHALAKG